MSYRSYRICKDPASQGVKPNMLSQHHLATKCHAKATTFVIIVLRALQQQAGYLDHSICSRSPKPWIQDYKSKNNIILWIKLRIFEHQALRLSCLRSWPCYMCVLLGMCYASALDSPGSQVTEGDFTTKMVLARIAMTTLTDQFTASMVTKSYPQVVKRFIISMSLYHQRHKSSQSLLQY